MWELIQESLATLRGNLLRTVLTMIGVILGVGAVVSIMAMGKSAYTTVSNEFVNSGFSSITITNIQQNAIALNNTTITFLESLDIPNVLRYAPKFSLYTEATDRFSNTFPVYVAGTTETSLENEDLTLLQGRLITPYDVLSRSQVTLIDSTTAEEFFYSHEEALGEKIRLNGTSYQIVGVYETKYAFVKDQGRIYAPISTLLENSDAKGYNSIDVVFSETANAGEIQEKITQALLQQRGFIDEDHADFRVSNPQNQLASIQQFFTVFSIFMSLVAAISLVVGGVGIMNIMLVTVTERTKEIGLLKALGAQKSDIIFQFLVESVVLTLFGGVLGVLLGILVSFSAVAIINAIDAFPDFSYGINYYSILVSLIVSIVIGLVFGAYPAKKAADLDPVVALRRE